MTVLSASSLHFVYTDKGGNVVFRNDSTLCQVALCHIQDRQHIHSYCCQNLISHTVSKYFRQSGASCYNGMARPPIAGGGDGLLMDCEG